MKKIIILAFMLTVSIMSFGQQKANLQPTSNSELVQKQDTVFTIRLNKQAVQVLFTTLEGFGPLIRRSPDLSALQADEAMKNITALGTEIFKQIKTQLPPMPETGNKKSEKSPK